MDNRHHLVVDSRVTLADGYGKRDAAQQMVAALAGEHPGTIGIAGEDWPLTSARHAIRATDNL